MTRASAVPSPWSTKRAGGTSSRRSKVDTLLGFRIGEPRQELCGFVQAKYWSPRKENNNVRRSVKIMNDAGFGGTFALEYEEGPWDVLAAQ